MLNLKHERRVVRVAWTEAQFVSAKDGALLCSARHAGPAWPATAPDVVDPANLGRRWPRRRLPRWRRQRRQG